jgi:hypothetical protein
LRELWLVPAVALTLTLIAPRIGDRRFRAVEDRASDFARSRWAIPAVGLLAIAFRLALLPILPVPQRSLHDENSLLLAADTFAHGRLTNPPHPLWIFFDTFHVLQHPTYASKYLPGSAAPLALGQLLGHPWLGSLLGLAAVCMAVTWMLRGWFSTAWALLGGVLFLFGVGLFSFWIDGYYGGAIPAIGAALVLGAYPRIAASLRVRDALWMGAGAALLATSRPLEGFVFCVPIAIALPVELFARRSHSIDLVARRVVLPVFAVLGATGLFLAYYDWRVTGDPLLLPWTLYHREYYNYPVFAWQDPGPPLHYDNPQFECYFLHWQRESWAPWGERSWKTAAIWWRTFLGVTLTIPLIALPWALRERRIRLVAIQFALCAAALLSVAWYQPHYAAPLAATLYVLIVGSMIALRRWKLRGRAIGVFVTRLVMVLALDWVLVLAAGAAWVPEDWAADRARFVRSLEAKPGRHLVIVHYQPDHDCGHEWVYNAADIDRARIVWAREIPGHELAPLLDYYRDRSIWRLEADAEPPRLSLVTSPGR